MNPHEASPFGRSAWHREAESLYVQFQKLFGLPEPLALLIAMRLPHDAGHLAKCYWGRPKIRHLATHESPITYGLALVKACVSAEESIESGKGGALPVPLPAQIRKYVDAVAAAMELNDGGKTARWKAAARTDPCPVCGQWNFEGRIEHTPNCSAKRLEEIRAHQSAQPTQKQQEEMKVNAAIATKRRAARLGPPISAPAPNKSKAHSYSSWPPIVPGGGVETNRRKH